jgi:AcrR family transcriptional regulator
VVEAARQLLETEGAEALTMRRLGDALGIRAPSLYKHFSGKQAVELALIEDAMAELGHALHQAVVDAGGGDAVSRLLVAYRAHALAHPNLYRLATSAPLARHDMAAGLEDWAGEPFYLATGEPHLAQALWAFAHGMVVLELDDRFLPGSDLDRTWAAGAATFITAGSA